MRGTPAQYIAKLDWTAGSEALHIPVDTDCLSGDVSGCRRAQKQSRRGNIVGRDHAPQRDFIEILFAHFALLNLRLLCACPNDAIHPLAFYETGQ